MCVRIHVDLLHVTLQYIWADQFWKLYVLVRAERDGVRVNDKMSVAAQLFSLFQVFVYLLLCGILESRIGIQKYKNDTKASTRNEIEYLLQHTCSHQLNLHFVQMSFSPQICPINVNCVLGKNILTKYMHSIYL